MKFITIGELLMRLSPPDYEKIRTTSSYVVNFGGAEANVAVSLANLGVDTTVFTVLPDNDIGRSAVRSLKANDVHTSPIIFGGERMGVYFLEEGIGVRSSKVIYDRKHSAFAEYDYTTVDFKALLEALKAYKKDPSFFTGKPKMPGYCKADKKTFKVTNQDAALYPTKDGKGCLLKLPKMDHNKIPLSYLKDTSNLREIVFKPYYGKYIMTFIIEDMAPPFYPDLPNMAGMDLGTDNIAAIACTDGSSVVYKGGAILSANQFFAKQKASAVSILTKGKRHRHASSAFFSNLS